MLDDFASPMMLLRKQTEKSGVWKTKLSFQPCTEQEEAGLVVWWNYFTHSTIGIRMGPKGREVCFKPAVGSLVAQKTHWSDSDVHLFVECGTAYRFGFREAGEETTWLGEVSNDIMTRPPTAGMAFTGMMIGLFACSKYQRSMNPADFYYLECRRGGD